MLYEGAKVAFSFEHLAPTDKTRHGLLHVRYVLRPRRKKSLPSHDRRRRVPALSDPSRARHESSTAMLALAGTCGDHVVFHTEHFDDPLMWATPFRARGTQLKREAASFRCAARAECFI